MDPETRQIIHMGINFVVSPTPTIDRQSGLSFLHSLTAQGVDFDKFEIQDREISVTCEAPARLDIKVVAVGAPAVGQLLIISPQPSGVLEMFIRQAEAVVRAFELTWPAKRQLISCDATIRDLYETSEQHAFMEIWETQLGQPPEKLAVLGGPVLGGGLRFIIPPKQEESDPLREVKIESFLRNTKKIFVETQFKWPQPISPGEPLDARGRLEQVDEYVRSKVVVFMGGEQYAGGDQ